MCRFYPCVHDYQQHFNYLRLYQTGKYLNWDPEVCEHQNQYKYAL